MSEEICFGVRVAGLIVVPLFVAKLPAPSLSLPSYVAGGTSLPLAGLVTCFDRRPITAENQQIREEP
jgi:hypothetical protein